MKKPEIGDILYSLNVGNAARHKEQELTPVAVKKVGRKYFTAGVDGKSWSNVRYHIKGWRQETNSSVTSVLYKDPEEWEESKEKTEISRFNDGMVSYGRFTIDISIDDARKIKAIFDKYVDAFNEQ